MFGNGRPQFTKNDLVDVNVMLSSVRQRTHTNQMSSSLSSLSSLSSINGISRSALHIDNQGSFVKTSITFQQHSQHRLHLEHHNYESEGHQYLSESRPNSCQLFLPSNHTIFGDNYFDQTNRTSSQINSTEYSGCPPINFTGNGWV